MLLEIPDGLQIKIEDWINFKPLLEENSLFMPQNMLE